MVTCNVSSDGAFSRPAEEPSGCGVGSPLNLLPGHAHVHACTVEVSGSEAEALMEIVSVADGCAGNSEAPQ